MNIREHTLAHVSIREHTSEQSLAFCDEIEVRAVVDCAKAAVGEVHEVAACTCRSIPHTSAYVSIRIRQHTSAYVSIRQHTLAHLQRELATTRGRIRIRQHTSAYVSIRQHTSAHLQRELATTRGLPPHPAPLGAVGARANSIGLRLGRS